MRRHEGLIKAQTSGGCLAWAHIRARIPGILHFLLSQPSHQGEFFGGIFDEKMRSFAMLYGADISRKKRRVFQDVLKYVRKVRAMN